jgi:hypothetical protein
MPKIKAKKVADATISNSSGFFTICALTKRARTWVHDNVQISDWQGSCESFVLDDFGYAWDIYQGMLSAGFNVGNG